jgi:integrase
VRKAELSVPNIETVTKIIDCAQERSPEIGGLLRLAAVTGARRGELCATRWREIDKGGVVTIRHSIVDGRVDELKEKDTKTHSSRIVSIDAVTLKIVNQQHELCEARATRQCRRLSGSEYMFASTNDGLIP